MQLIEESEIPTADPLALLENWSRKHYQFKIESGRFIAAGDGVVVTLTGGGRTVSVEDIELDVWDEDKDFIDKYADTGDTIREAIRQWYADRTQKKFRVLFSLSNYVGELPIGYAWFSKISNMAIVERMDTCEYAVVSPILLDFPSAKIMGVWEQGLAR